MLRHVCVLSATHLNGDFLIESQNATYGLYGLLVNLVGYLCTRHVATTRGVGRGSAYHSGVLDNERMIP